MKKNSPFALFWGMFLRAVVIILGLVIIAFGIFFLTQVIKAGKNDKSSNTTTMDSNSLTEPEAQDDLMMQDPDDVTEEEIVNSYDKKLLVLNSTNVSGLAGRWCSKLNGYGYANTQAADYDTEQVNTRIIATEDGVGKDLVQYFKAATYEVGTVSEGASVSTTGYDIVIIIGAADSE